MLEPDDLAIRLDVIGCALREALRRRRWRCRERPQPNYVDINEIVLRPTTQAF
ncbi:MAG: hypothetical protein IBJ08_02470 [Pseudomonas sp.]|jgi:hypothetical protein|uniref:hypothetical protein n=1 Tax=Ectopseudomonas mendocina TaxID=300 RepID=UPI001611BAD6|nr:hypothetical protein [Pseudomonas mendocina]MBL0949574.1 hypothetical protein [Pseudomonas sp.]QTN47855.1 hypothetical protein H7683_09575 [Pseudomonas mendocina]